MNYTEKITANKGDFNETVQYWKLQKIRKLEECGVWIDGKQVANYTNMENFVEAKPIPEKFHDSPV